MRATRKYSVAVSQIVQLASTQAFEACDRGSNPCLGVKTTQQRMLYRLLTSCNGVRGIVL